MEVFKSAAHRSKTGDDSKDIGLVTDVLLPLVDHDALPNFLLLIFWAAHANATPVSFLTNFLVAWLLVV